MNTSIKNIKSLNNTQEMIRTIGEKPLGTALLAFRDMSSIISKHIQGINALDFGCGAGRSSRMLKEFGLKVTAVDISIKMIDQAIKASKDINYMLIKKNCFENLSFEHFFYQIHLLLFSYEHLYKSVLLHQLD